MVRPSRSAEPTLICKRGRCPLVVGKYVTWKDEGHLSASWVRHLTEALDEQMTAAHVWP